MTGERLAVNEEVASDQHPGFEGSSGAHPRIVLFHIVGFPPLCARIETNFFFGASEEGAGVTNLYLPLSREI